MTIDSRLPDSGRGPVDWQDAIRIDADDWLGDPGPSFAVGEGWSTLIASMFNRIGIVARSSDPPATVWLPDVKEKYGLLSVSWFGALDADQDRQVDAIVDAAERASSTICDACGKRGTMRSTRGDSQGWLAVRCEEHSEGFPYR